MDKKEIYDFIKILGSKYKEKETGEIKTIDKIRTEYNELKFNSSYPQYVIDELGSFSDYIKEFYILIDEKL